MTDSPAPEPPAPRSPRAPRRRPIPVTPEMVDGAPQFAPVPRRSTRFDGWSHERQRAFVKCLAETGGVRRAAEHVGMSEVGAYQLRKAEGAEEFRKAWDDALAIGVRRLSDIAFDRAINGVPVPIVHKGEIVGEKRAYNDRLLMWTLRHHDPDRYGDGQSRGDGASPLVKQRLRAEAQAEIEALAEEVAMLRAFVDGEIRRWRIQGMLIAKFSLMGCRLKGWPDRFANSGKSNFDHAERLRIEYEAACPPAPGPGRPPVPFEADLGGFAEPPEWIMNAADEPPLPGLYIDDVQPRPAGPVEW